MTLSPLRLALGAHLGQVLTPELAAQLEAQALAADTALVQRLEDHILQGPQVDLRTTHRFMGGMYARTIALDAGTTLTGAIHTTDHLNIVDGDISVTTDDGVVRLTGRHVLATKAGMKRAGYAHGPTAWTTVCKTEHTDLALAEQALVQDAERLQTRTLQPDHYANLALEN